MNRIKAGRDGVTAMEIEGKKCGFLGETLGVVDFSPPVWHRMLKPQFLT